MKLETALANLPVKSQKIVVDEMITGGIIFYNNGDWRLYFINCHNKAVGMRKQIYKLLAELTDLEFDNVLKFFILIRNNNEKSGAVNPP